MGPFNRKNGGIFNAMMDDLLTNDLSKLIGTTFRLDVQETETEYLIEADMPGFKKEEISMELIDSKLVISVKKEEAVESEQKNYIHKERKCSEMSRTVYLPDSKPENIKASLADGVLTVRIPKDEEAKNRRKIDIE